MTRCRPSHGGRPGHRRREHAGALAEVAAAISDAGVNIAAATCIGPGDRAELHILVPHAEAARHSLAISHLAVSREREVVVVDVEDRPGVLADLTRKIAKAGVDLDLVYVATRNRVVFGAARPRRPPGRAGGGEGGGGGGGVRTSRATRQSSTQGGSSRVRVGRGDVCRLLNTEGDRWSRPTRHSAASPSPTSRGEGPHTATHSASTSQKEHEIRTFNLAADPPTLVYPSPTTCRRAARSSTSGRRVEAASRRAHVPRGPVQAPTRGSRE